MNDDYDQPTVSALGMNSLFDADKKNFTLVNSDCHKSFKLELRLKLKTILAQEHNRVLQNGLHLVLLRRICR